MQSLEPTILVFFSLRIRIQYLLSSDEDRHAEQRTSGVTSLDVNISEIKMKSEGSLSAGTIDVITH